MSDIQGQTIGRFTWNRLNYRMMVTKVKKRVALLLRRWPTLHNFMTRIYFALNPVHLMELLVGTKAREKKWATRHLHRRERRQDDWGTGSDDWIKGYWDSKNHPHRQFLIEAISK